jgi:hypothetical protein
LGFDDRCCNRPENDPTGGAGERDGKRTGNRTGRLPSQSSTKNSEEVRAAWRKQKANQRARDREFLEDDLIKLDAMVLPRTELSDYLRRLQFVKMTDEDTRQTMTDGVKGLVLSLILDPEKGDLST